MKKISAELPVKLGKVYMGRTERIIIAFGMFIMFLINADCTFFGDSITAFLRAAAGIMPTAEFAGTASTRLYTSLYILGEFFAQLADAFEAIGPQKIGALFLASLVSRAFCHVFNILVAVIKKVVRKIKTGRKKFRFKDIPVTAGYQDEPAAN